MRIFIFISLLLLTFLVQEARGIRLLSARPPKAIDSLGDIEDSSLCKGNHRCLEPGRIRKLATKTTSASSSSTPSKKDKNDHENGNTGRGSGQAGHSNNERTAGDKEESVYSSTTTNKNLKHDLGRYPDLLDIVGMDYSPARRKPPIHN